MSPLPFLTLLAACSASAPVERPPPAPLTVHLAASLDGEVLPMCGAGQAAPALSWEPRAGFVSWLIWSDAPAGRRIHWMAWDQPAESGGPSAGVRAAHAPPLQGRNGAGSIGWWAACDLDPAPLLQIRAWHTDRPVAAPPTVTPDAFVARVRAIATVEGGAAVAAPPPPVAATPPEAPAP